MRAAALSPSAAAGPGAAGARWHAALLSAAVCVALFAWAALQSTAVFHWFVFPIFLCGVLIGRDGIAWVLGRRDLYDPVGILGLLGIHAFYAAPLLHVAWDHWMRFVEPPPDWREWLGLMGCINLVGIVLYQATVAAIESRAARRAAGGFAPPGPAVAWHPHPQRFTAVALFALVVTFAAQMWTFVAYGGVGGYVEAFEAGPQSFQGMGMFFLVGESFPIVAIIAYVIWVRRSGRTPGWGELAALVIAFFLVRMLFGGLRGSRSNVVWAVFWAVGILHLFVRRVPRVAIVWGVVGLIVFMYVYGFYKIGGLTTVLRAAEGAEARDEISRRYGRTVEAAILSDLARADGQAHLLYRLLRPGADYDYAWGRTYVGAAALLVPRQLWPDRPETKILEGTNASYGANTYTPGRFYSSNVYGIAGEAMLNFGPWVVPLFYVLFGALVAWSGTLAHRLTEGDVRRVMLPVLVNMCFVVLMGDSDNLVVFMFQNAMIPMALLYVGSRAVPVDYRAAPATGAAIPGAEAGDGAAARGAAVRRWGRRPQAELAGGGAGPGSASSAAAGSATLGADAGAQVHLPPPRHGPQWGSRLRRGP